MFYANLPPSLAIKQGKKSKSNPRPRLKRKDTTFLDECALTIDRKNSQFAASLIEKLMFAAREKKRKTDFIREEQLKNALLLQQQLAERTPANLPVNDERPGSMANSSGKSEIQLAATQLALALAGRGPRNSIFVKQMRPLFDEHPRKEGNFLDVFTRPDG